MVFFDAINWGPDPEIFKIGSFALRWYSLCFVIGFSFGFIYVRNLFRKENISDDKMDKLLMYIVLSTILGARLGHVLFYDLDYYMQRPFLEAILPVKIEDGIEFVGFSGLASHGGAAAIILTLYFYSKRVVKKPVYWVYDRITPAIAFAACFIRIGNFINSEIVGNPTNSSFGVIFNKLDQFPRHPAQLYEAIGYLILFFITHRMVKHNKLQQPWYLFSSMLVILFSIRIIVEFFKRSQGGFEETFTLLSTGQWLSIPFILLGVILYRIGKNIKVA